MTAVEEDAEPPNLKPVSSKSVLIAEPEALSPQPSPKEDPVERTQLSRNSFPSKQFRTNTSRRLSGRPAPDTGALLHSISSISTVALAADPAEQHDTTGGHGKHHQHSHRHRQASHVISQVAVWLDHEKAKKAARRHSKHGGHRRLAHAAEATKDLVNQIRSNESQSHQARPRRTNSDVSDDSLALEKLEQILTKSMDLGTDGSVTPTGDKTDSYFPRLKTKRQGSKKLLRKSSTMLSSDTEYQEPDIDVPSAEVILDNSKTLGYSGGGAISEVDLTNSNKRAVKEKEAWLHFKREIVRLCHTLRLKGWRRLPLELAKDIDVERLSGALTNAVYVVSPPSNLPQTPAIPPDSTESIARKSPPPKLLLRIYGPQVEHLIDRESELQILRRLARKKIGPRLLGTFINGRFEQFFHARTLTAKDLRIPETSKHIAKRMRELHDGIELLEEEHNEGAFIWRNWDKWKDRCEEVISWLDNQILENKQGNATSHADDWKNRGLVCGVEWSVFRAAVRKYRDWLFEQYGGISGVKDKLVFAHNDTQYGNLLRLQPSGESPLLLPSNEHKQLVVIDFEYASANLPGLEFANHFTEWCYDYHGSPSHTLHESWYPTPEEQHRFLKAYVQHRSPIQARTPATPATASTPGPINSISSFMLDSRAPPAQIEKEEKQCDANLEAEIERLSHETRLWRVANSAQWVAWGIVQAKVPGMDEALEALKRDSDNSTPKAEDADLDGVHASEVQPDSDPLSTEILGVAEDARDKRPEEDGGEEEEFDYLGYAQERAMFFWGDVLQLGIVGREELPEDLLKKVKVVEY